MKIIKGTGSIDVCMMTKNSNKPVFKQCLESIKRSDIPINRFIAIDNNSTDGTQKAIKKIFPKAIIVNLGGNLAYAREKAIEMVETEWFAFIDSDAVLPDNWYSEISKYKASGEGLESWDWSYVDNKLTKSPRDDHARAMTIADLIKTKYVKGIKIPKELFFLEDEYVRRYLERMGGHWVKTGVRVFHYSENWHIPPFKKGYFLGRYKIYSNKNMLIKAFGNIMLRNESMGHYWRMYFGYLWGRLNEAGNN